MLRTSAAKAVVAAPAPWFVTGLGAVAALVTAFGHLTPAEAATIYSIAGAAGTIVTAAVTRPVGVTAITGAAGVILGDLTILNVHLSSAEIASVVSGISLVLGLFLHLIHVPALQVRDRVP